MKLIIASNNKGKIREYKQLLEPLGYEVFSQSEAGIDIEVEETGSTFAENSALKARAIFSLAKCAVLADDSGLVVDFLNGEPGVYSARYGGLKTDSERSALLLKRLNGVSREKRTAHFACTIHFIKENGEEISVEGRVNGIIGTEPVGENGFGYDPIFMYGDKSFAQLDDSEKNSVSHRGNALRKLVAELSE
jgi:XTP/dITP diphosphohydrolase